MNWQVGQRVYDHKYHREGVLHEFVSGSWVIKFQTETITMWGRYKVERMGVRFEVISETKKEIVKEQTKTSYENVLVIDFVNKKKVV